LPRIDPSGERVLIWPKDEPQAAILAPPSSVVAPPVVTDPVFPQPAVVSVAPAAGPSAVVATPGATPASLALAAAAQDKVTIAPERILAPVGSEVVLKASVCTVEGYTLADQKVEWMLGRNGVGQFVEVGGKGWFHPPLLPWNKPKKVDNYLAEGWTANGPLCITRGTPDPTDDVEINRGDAWTSITSANEGTSYVTAYMPKVESWNARRGAATIYWVDVQWTFPPSTISGTGRPETLTTTVTRQTSGAPIEGWIVRYAVNEGGGALSGPGSGQVVEMRTDAQGRASVDVSPTASGAASSRVDVELIRPAGFGGGDAPRLVIGTGSTIIQWSGGGTPYLPGGASSSQPATPTPTIPDAVSPSAPSAPTMPPGGWGAPSTGSGATAPSAPAARPQLEVILTGDATALVGGQARLTLEVRNTGAGAATNVRVIDRFDSGLMYPGDPNANELDATGAPLSLAAGESQKKTEPIIFDVVQPGRLCHNVSVTSAEGASASAQFCVTATQPAEERTGHATVTMDGPLQQEVGQAALFRITVRNDGQLPLNDIDVTERYPTRLLRIAPPNDPAVRVASGVITRRIERLEPGQPFSFQTQCMCLQPARPVLPLPNVSISAVTEPATARIETGDDHQLEILPMNPGAGGAAAPDGAGAGGPAAGAATGPLGINLELFNQPARVGTRATCRVVVVNRGAVDDQRVIVRVAFPPQLVPDVTAIEAPPNVRASFQNGQLTFTAVEVLRPGEPLTYLIPMNVLASDVVDVVAGVVSANAPGGVSRTATQEIIP
jgi:uncharacterized repeat protein (TIGR01451 family)